MNLEFDFSEKFLTIYISVNTHFQDDQNVDINFTQLTKPFSESKIPILKTNQTITNLPHALYESAKLLPATKINN